jgi:galactonate dehydratase
MKITDIKCYPLWFGRNQLVVKIETDSGLYGLGEAGLSGRELAVMGAIDHFKQWLVGKDPMRTGALWQEMYRSQYFEGGRVLTAAQSAIDIALYDIKGKHLGVPIYELIGGKHRDFVPCFISLAAPTTEEEAREAKALIEDGWTCLRLGRKTGDGSDPDEFDPRASLAPTADALVRARELLGSGVSLGIDYHHRLSVAETASFCHRMPRGTLDFLEEPIRDENPGSYASLRTMVDVPFAIGEEFSSKWQFLPYIEQGLTNFARIDICNVGGFTEAMKVAGWAEAHYIDIMPHNPLGPICTAASIHLCAAAPNMAWLESKVGQYADDAPEREVFSHLPQNSEGMFPVLEKPGLGVELLDGALDDFDTGAFRYWEAPHLHRPDGSVTNW